MSNGTISDIVTSSFFFELEVTVFVVRLFRFCNLSIVPGSFNSHCCTLKNNITVACDVPMQLNSPLPDDEIDCVRVMPVKNRQVKSSDRR